MALLQRTRILPQQRIDLPDFNNIEDFICADFKAIHKNVWTSENFVFSGFEASGTGTTDLNVALAGSSAVLGEDDGVLYIGATSLDPLSTSALTPSSTNFVEIFIEQDTGGADSRAFWDQTAAGGAGGEFSQIIDTFIFLKSTFAINTSNFTGDANKLPLCEVDVNASGVITEIRDSRNMFYRLGRRNDTEYSFPWTSRVEPADTQFNGADKDISRMKEFFDALMSRILELSGGTHWYEDIGVSIVGSFRNAALSAITGIGSNTKWSWDGTNLSLSDDNGAPADADTVAAIRLLDSTANLLLTRMDGTGGSSTIALADGEVLWIELPDPLTDVTYDDVGLTSANFRISARGSVPSDDSTFWLAYREGNNAYLRYLGELEPGETAEISDNINENILNIIGVPTETSDPNYSSTNVITQNADLVQVIGELDAAAGASSTGSAQDRSLKVIEGGTWNLVDNAGTLELILSADAYIQMPGLTNGRNTIQAATLSLPNANSVAYVEVDRTAGVDQNLTVTIADVDTLSPTANTVIIARRVSDGVLVGAHSFLLKVGEYLELDGALAEINRLLGQLRIKPHESDLDKARISTADIALLDGTTLGQVIGDFILKFDGAVIDFTTGNIFESDGTTPLGTNFTPQTIPVGEYFWYGISLIPGLIDTDNRQLATVQVDLAGASNASQSAAVKPVISGDIKLGIVQVVNNAGSIERADILKLGVGSGSGSGGAGSDPSLGYEKRLDFNSFNKVATNIFETDKDTYVDGASTGAYSPAKKSFEFSAIGQTMVDTQNFDASYLASERTPTEVELYVKWLEIGIDPTAVYEVSRNGGLEWQTVTMERVDDTNAFNGRHIFSKEAVQQTLISQAVNNGSTELNNTTQQKISQTLTVADTSLLRDATLNFTKDGSPVGKVIIAVKDDNAGDPGEVIKETPAINVADITAGNNTFDISELITAPGTYHLELRTDAEYKAAFVTTVTSLRLSLNTTGGGVNVFNGTTWSSSSAGLVHQIDGIELDLRTRITSSAADTYLESYGIYFDNIPGVVTSSSVIPVDRFFFTGTENKTQFQLTNISNPDPDFLEVFDRTRGQSYVASESTFRIVGQTLVFITDFFNDPGEDIEIEVRQTKGEQFDGSAENANKIADIENRLLDIADGMDLRENSVVLPRIAAPFSTVQNRALVADMSQDLSVIGPVNRIMTQGIKQLDTEIGPNGEMVHEVVNDKFGQIRFVGDWNSGNSTQGLLVVDSAGGASSFVEVTFYGTGLNAMYSPDTTARDYRATVDGGVEGSNFYINGSNIIVARNYSQNQISNVVSGLPLGFHTIKIRNAHASANMYFYGFETINESTDIVVNAGAQIYKGKKLVNPTQHSSAYNADFETGTLGTKGGAVVVYQKSDGSIAKAVNPVDATQLNLAAADHSNEELVKHYNFREFGAGRNDDLSTMKNVLDDNSFTLADGTTTLVCDNFLTSNAGGREILVGTAADTTSALYLTFVGTGLDLEIWSDNTIRTLEVTVDGNILGTLTEDESRWKTAKIVSGLPYGTHTVKLRKTYAPADTIYFSSFKIYGPKKPSVPTGAKAISSYNIMADFAANSSSNNLTLSTGVLRKNIEREFTYLGSWPGGISFNTNVSASANYADSSTASDSLSYTFLGTGFDFRFFHSSADRSSSVLIELDVHDGSGFQTLNTANFGTIATDAATNSYGVSFTAATGILNTRLGTGTGGLVVQGLALGSYTIRATNQNGGQRLSVTQIDIITPVHTPKVVGDVIIQNEGEVGSQSVADLRQFSKNDISRSGKRAFSHAITSGSSVVLADGEVPYRHLTNIIETSGGYLDINVSMGFVRLATNNAVTFSIFVNGKSVEYVLDYEGDVGRAETISFNAKVEMAPGRHIVQAFWNSGTTSGTDESGLAHMNVREVKES